MPDISSETLILALKTIFCESGVSNILITDNGRQYCSKEFKEFSLEWSFVHKSLLSKGKFLWNRLLLLTPCDMMNELLL